MKIETSLDNANKLYESDVTVDELRLLFGAVPKHYRQSLVSKYLSMKPPNMDLPMRTTLEVSQWFGISGLSHYDAVGLLVECILPVWRYK